MGWLEDLANLAASAASAVGDLIEGAVDTVTQAAESGVDAVQDVVDNVGTGVRDWIAGNTNPILTGLSNVVFGLVGGAVQSVPDVVRIELHVISGIGHVAADILRLDVAAVIGDSGDVVIGLLEIGFADVRLVTGGYFAGAIVDNFNRDRGLAFIKMLITDEFDDKTAETVLQRLGFGGVRVGLRMPIDYSVLRMDSALFPLAADHNAGVFDLFAMAGIVSFSSFRINRERTRVVIVDSTGRDQWFLPVGRSVIQSFLDTGAPRLRVYAWENYAASRAMRSARRKLRKLFILANFGSIEYLSRFRAASVIDITTTEEYLMHDESRYYELGRFLATNTNQDGELLDDTRIAAIGSFRFANPKLNGITAAVGIKRGTVPGCGGDDATKPCTTTILRAEGDYDLSKQDPRGTATGDPLTHGGRGVLHRDTYPPYFSQFVLAHELGHHFGLAHPGHAGVQNIMVSPDQDFVPPGILKFWYQGEPDFDPKDLEQAWRFIVRRMPHVLGG